MDQITSITCECPARIEVAGKVFVTTGEFQRDRFALEKSIVAMGGILKGHCSRYSDYLIVGGRGPSCIWKFGNYGTKLERAVRLRDAGFPLLVVMEADFLRAAVPGRTIKQCVPHANAIPAWEQVPVLMGGHAVRSW